MRGSIVENFIIGMLLVLDRLCMLIPRTQRNLAVVVRLDAIGDYFLWLRTGAVDVSVYAKAAAGKVALLTSPAVAPFARETGLWDEVLELSEYRFGFDPLYRLRMMSRIRRLGGRLLIQARASRALWMEDAIARASGISGSIGSSGTLLRATELQRQRGNRHYARLISVDPDLHTHESLRNAQFTEGLTGHMPTPFRFETPDRRLQGGHILVALGAGDRGRVWPIEKLARALAHIDAVHPGVAIIVAGTTVDSADVQQLKALSDVPFQSQVGGTSLKKFVELVATSRLVLCNESAAYHIAMTYQRDIVCLLGGGHFGTFVPYPEVFPGEMTRCNRAADVAIPMDCFGCNWRCIYPRSESGTYRCIDQLPVESVTAAVDSLLTAKRLD